MFWSFPKTYLQAWDLWLKPVVETDLEFIPLSVLLEKPEDISRAGGEVYLGRFREKISLSEIEDALKREHRELFTPKIRGSNPHILLHLSAGKKLIVANGRDEDNAESSFSLSQKKEVSLLPEVEVELSLGKEAFADLDTLDLEKTQGSKENNVILSSELDKKLSYEELFYVVLNKSVRRGELLNESDLELKGFDKAQAGACEKVSEVVGLEAVRVMHRGSVVGKKDIQKSPLVSRGQWVSLTFKDGSVKVFARGKSLQDGQLGEVIQIRRGRETVPGKITARGEAEVVFTAP